MKRLPLLVLATGFGFSLAANIMWCWPGGPVRILGGALASVALPAAVHMLPMIVAGHWTRRVLRNLVLGAIAGLAAATTFSHASSLLIAAGELRWLAHAYPIMTELLVVFAVLARCSPPQRQQRQARTPHVGAVARPRQATPRAGVAASTLCKAPVASLTEAPSPTETGADEVRTHRAAMNDRVEWLRAREPERATDEIAALREEFGISMSTAKRIRVAAGRVAS